MAINLAKDEFLKYHEANRGLWLKWFALVCLCAILFVLSVSYQVLYVVAIAALLFAIVKAISDWQFSKRYHRGCQILQHSYILNLAFTEEPTKFYCEVGKDLYRGAQLEGMYEGKRICFFVNYASELFLIVPHINYIYDHRNDYSNFEKRMHKKYGTYISHLERGSHLGIRQLYAKINLTNFSTHEAFESYMKELVSEIPHQDIQPFREMDMQRAIGSLNTREEERIIYKQ